MDTLLIQYMLRTEILECDRYFLVTTSATNNSSPTDVWSP